MLLLILFAWLMSVPVIICGLAIARFIIQYRQKRIRQLHETHVLTFKPTSERYAYSHSREMWHRKRN